MTSLVGWIAVDQRGPSSIYLAADSRISWDAMNTWDRGRKVFASQHKPDLLGYLGDVVFPSLVLSQLMSAIDAGTLFAESALPQDRFERVRGCIEESFSGVPGLHRREFHVIYVTRQGSGMASRFTALTVAWHPTRGWSTGELPLPDRSDVFYVGGTGAPVIKKWRERWNATREKGTSRAVFSSFCDALASSGDPFTGGPPQLAGLHRIGAGLPFGILYRGEATLYGLPLKDPSLARNVDWFNTAFERCDPGGQRLSDAQTHRIPKGLGLSVDRSSHT